MTGPLSLEPLGSSRFLSEAEVTTRRIRHRHFAQTQLSRKLNGPLSFINESTCTSSSTTSQRTQDDQKLDEEFHECRSRKHKDKESKSIVMDYDLESADDQIPSEGFRFGYRLDENHIDHSENLDEENGDTDTRSEYHANRTNTFDGVGENSSETCRDRLKYEESREYIELTTIEFKEDIPEPKRLCQVQKHNSTHPGTFVFIL